MNFFLRLGQVANPTHKPTSRTLSNCEGRLCCSLYASSPTPELVISAVPYRQWIITVYLGKSWLASGKEPLNVCLCMFFSMLLNMRCPLPFVSDRVILTLCLYLYTNNIIVTILHKVIEICKTFSIRDVPDIQFWFWWAGCPAIFQNLALVPAKMIPGTGYLSRIAKDSFWQLIHP